MQNQGVPHEEWLKARRELPAAEKEFTRRWDALMRRPMAMPWERVEKSDRFEGAADGLCLAAAPIFAIMALLTAVLGGGPLDALCSAGHDASLLSGMVPMYLLMSAFHSPPWLRRIARLRSRASLVRA